MFPQYTFPGPRSSATRAALAKAAHRPNYGLALGGFVEAVWGLLVVASNSSSRERLIVTAIKFLTTVSMSVHHTLFARDDILQQICQSIVIPNVMLRDEDEELFEMNYVDFVRRDMEGSDLDTRRRIACELLKGIAMNYKEKVTVLSIWLSPLQRRKLVEGLFRLILLMWRAFLGLLLCLSCETKT